MEIWKNTMLPNEKLLREKPPMMMMVNLSGVSIIELILIILAMSRCVGANCQNAPKF